MKFLTECISLKTKKSKVIGRVILLFSLALSLTLCKSQENSKPPRQKKPHIEAVRPEPWAGISKVVLIILENTDYEYAIEQPFIKELANRGALLQSYYALERQSQPNYIALVSGSTFGTNNDNVTLNKTHIGDLLEQKGKTWKAYAQGYPGTSGRCFLDIASGPYARRHVPFLSFKNIQQTDRCARVVNADSFQSDLENGTLPDFSIYIPNNNNNGHDTGVAFATNWLSGFLNPILENQNLLKGTLFVLTFDEGTVGSPGENHVATILFGEGIKPGTESSQDYDHYSLLRTFEEIFHLPTLGRNDQSAAPIDDVWN